MNDAERDGLKRLQRDLESPELPAPELLARYATDPNGLTPEERDEIDRAMARSPAVVDELDTLRQFDFSLLDADSAGATRPALLSWLVGLLSSRPQVVAITMAAAALALWLVLGQGSPDAPEQDSRLVQGPGPAPEVVPDAMPDPIVPTPRAVEPPPSEHRPSPSALAQRPDVVPGPSPDASLAQGPEVPEAPAPRDGGSSDASGEGEPILLAMTMPRYQPAFGIESPAGVDWIVRGSEQQGAQVSLIGPQHVTRVSQASPALHWSIDRLPASGAFYLTLVDADDEPVVLDLPLPVSDAAGLQRIDLAALGVALPPDAVIRWSVALRADPEAPPESFQFGWLRFVPLSAPESEALARTAAADRSAFFAALGCFHEALDAALAERSAHPEDPDRQRAVSLLLEQSAEPDAG